MTLSPQADTFNIPSKTEDYLEPIAPSGTVGFLDGENVGLHVSDLDRITREATDIAVPMHVVTQHETLDGKRLEYGYGQAVVEAAQYPEPQPRTTIVAQDPGKSMDMMPNDTGPLLVASANITGFRRDLTYDDQPALQRK